MFIAQHIPIAPRSVSGLVLWVETADQATIIPNGGDASAISDKSGSGLSFVESIDVRQPVIIPDPLPDTALSFEDAHFMTMSNFAGLNSKNEYTIFFVGRGDLAQSNTIINLLSGDPLTSSTSHIFLNIRGHVNDRLRFLHSSYSPNVFDDITAGSLAINDSQIMRFYRSDIEQSTYINGADKVILAGGPTAAAIPAGPNGLVLGVLRPNSLQQFLDGELEALLIYDRALLDSESNGIESYLATKRNITLP